ncbi:MAG: S8 family serine peptidase [Planctomycetota bacterium]|nr:S8 family serine peptidase [Planctomycetota bacterium]
MKKPAVVAAAYGDGAQVVAAPDPAAVLSSLVSQYGAQSVEAVFPKLAEEAKQGSALLATGEPSAAAGDAEEPGATREDLGRWYQVDLAAGADAAAVAASLADDPRVEAAEPNGYWHIAGFPSAQTDPGYAQQWHLTAARVPETWQLLADHGINPGGSRDVVIAVIDTGVDYTHQDLVANMWTNPNEIPGNGVDDDHNGFVDDIHGASVAYDPPDHSGDPVDMNGHGTHVAGIAAATAFNLKGGAGVAFNAQIMAVRAAQPNGVLTYTDVSEGVMYAVNNGADVINMSFAGMTPSQLMEDALAVAFNQAVLVAAAGNGLYGGWITFAADERPFYPAAWPWVLGVMASDRNNKLAEFTNYDDYPGTDLEYEVAAPGVDIYSTIPGNKYAAWSGTSMATPVVSGIAALLRSYYSDRAMYSSRYIMGQIQSTTSGFKGNKPKEPAPVVDPVRAITVPVKPNVWVIKDWLFDPKTQADVNNEDGDIDAGETIQLGLQIMNYQGAARVITATLSSADPYVSIVTASTSFGNLGPLGTTDNGFTYASDGKLIRIDRPLAFAVKPSCPNGYVIDLTVRLDYRSADLNDPGLYSSGKQVSYVVRRGRTLPKIISQDMTLTSSDLWVVTGPVLIQTGVTVTVQPGTYVQFGGLSADPYNPGLQDGSLVVRGRLVIEGSAQDPVRLFPFEQINTQASTIGVSSGGYGSMRYAWVTDAVVAGFATIDHCYFDRLSGNPQISAAFISNTIFHKMGGSTISGRLDTCLFDAATVAPTTRDLSRCVFLQDNESDHALTMGLRETFEVSSVHLDASSRQGRYESFVVAFNSGGQTYAVLYFDGQDFRETALFVAEAIASYFGGHVASIASSSEQALLTSNWPYNGVIGLTDKGHPGTYTWLDGTPLAYTNWSTGQPVPPETAEPFAATMGIENWRNSNVGEPVDFWIKIPGTLTRADLNNAMWSGDVLPYVLSRLEGQYYHNAFLSKLWDLDISHWMRLYGEPPSPGSDKTDAYSILTGCWFGTTSRTIIDHAIFDYQDDFSSGQVKYEPLPDDAPSDTYPFVESVIIDDKDALSSPTIGAGSVTIAVTFNRDMNTAIQPFVTFGPAAPYTDFRVAPIGAGWVNPRTWKGTYNVSAWTGEGYHLMRISGAVAASDPWLVSGYDVGRYRFQVKTMGVSAMTLQASGQEGAVRLSWQQDDYQLLAGYNLYRTSSINGVYKRINKTIILSGDEGFVDTDVQPAVPQYYKFTVVTTDLNESGFSNVASAASLDTIPPAIAHVPVVTAAPAFALRLEATATDNVAVQSVTLHYRTAGSVELYAVLPMFRLAGDTWIATIPGSAIQPPGVEYYITATDGISEVFNGTPVAPHSVVVQNTPTLSSVSPGQGSIDGGTPVTLGGTMFQQGAQVLFGAMPASDVVVLSSTQITCTIPPHFPAQVDVTVINPDSSQATLLNGFRFRDEGVILSLPAITADRGAIVDIPLSLANVSGLRAADITIGYDAAVLAAREARVGPLASGFSLAPNLSTPGTVRLSMASATAVSGSGALVYLTFEVIGPPTSTTGLSFGTALLNDGAISCQISPGTFTVKGLFTLSGKVSYYADGKPVPGTQLSLVGAGVHQATSSSDGTYLIPSVQTGAYTLTPSKANDVVEITAYDASLVLQYAAGLLSLSDQQKLAADVNRNGLITSMDASYILEQSVGLLTVPFQGAGKVWDFTPANRGYSLLNGDLSGQDFTAILIGDVSGNWQRSGTGMARLAAASSGSASLSLGTVEAAPSETVAVPVSIDPGSSEIRAADLVVTYDPSQLSLIGVEAGSAAANSMYAFNTAEPGVIRAGFAKATSFAQGGTLMRIQFQVVGDLETPTSIDFQAARLNEGGVTADLESGMVRDYPMIDVGAGQVFEVAASRRLKSLSIADGGRVNLTPGGEKLVLVRSLAISPGGLLDLADNDMIVANGDPAVIGAWIKSGQLIGKGEKYTTLAAVVNDKGDAKTRIKDTFGGQDVGLSDVLIKYSCDGDANLDGVVNADDYFQIDSGFISRKKGYYNGDFNYDDVVNADDYFLIDSAYIGQSGPLATSKPDSSAVSADVVVQPKTKKAEPDGILSQLFSTGPML